MAVIIDGKQVSKEILEDLKEKTAKLGKKPGLAVILANVYTMKGKRF
jgi:5,10-methylene-tetrahydrofolate dehydrogenase/methenyl tetrahydrofolate cyclohydrolase